MLGLALPSLFYLLKLSLIHLTCNEIIFIFSSFASLWLEKGIALVKLQNKQKKIDTERKEVLRFLILNALNIHRRTNC